MPPETECEGVYALEKTGVALISRGGWEARREIAFRGLISTASGVVPYS